MFKNLALMTPLARRRYLFRAVRLVKWMGASPGEAYRDLRALGASSIEADEITVRVYKGDPNIIRAD
jgi:hypothetical protein